MVDLNENDSDISEYDGPSPFRLFNAERCKNLTIPLIEASMKRMQEREQRWVAMAVAGSHKPLFLSLIRYYSPIRSPDPSLA